MKKRVIYTGKDAVKAFCDKLEQMTTPKIPEQPFSGKSVKLVFNGSETPKGYRDLLTQEEKNRLKEAVPNLTDAGVEAVLRRVYNMGDDRVRSLTWKEVLTFCDDYVRGQSQDLGTVEPKPAETIVLTEEQVKLLNWFMEHHPVIKSVLHFGKFTEKTNLKNADILRQKGLLRKADKGQGRGDIITEKGILYIQDHF